MSRGCPFVGPVPLVHNRKHKVRVERSSDVSGNRNQASQSGLELVLVFEVEGDTVCSALPVWAVYKCKYIWLAAERTQTDYDEWVLDILSASEVYTVYLINCKSL